MPKKKIKKKTAKKERIAYLIQHEDEKQIISWWDAAMSSWTEDPLLATVYSGEPSVEKEIQIIHDEGVEYDKMSPVEADPILRKKKDWKENPPIKYIDNPKKKKSVSNVKIVPGTILLDQSEGEPKPMIVTKVTENNSVFSVRSEFPVYVVFDPMDYLVKRIETGHIKILWSPSNKIR